MGWIKPTGFNANTNQWHNPTNCYDGNLSTYGWDRIYPLPFTGYYIEFNISEIQCNKIRFNAGNDNGKADKIDIDVYYNGSWHNVYYRGTYSTHVWVEVSLGGTYQVTKARVRFLASQIWLGGQGWLYEFNFYQIEEVSAGWVDEPYAYDKNTGSAAYCLVNSIKWTPYLIHTLYEPIYSSSIKFIAFYEGPLGINTIDLDAYYNGAWHNVFQGSYLNQVWVEKSLADTYFISAIRVRFYNNGSVNKTAYVYELQVPSSIGVPKVTTNAATDVGDGKATLNGDITNTGGDVCTVRGFKYKEGTGGAEQDTSDSGSFSTGAYSKELTGLDPTKEYYFRAYATNTSGTGYGEWKSFGEDITIPTVTTSAATSVDYEKAVLNGNITDTGGEDPTERGFQYKIGENSTIRTIRETGSFGIGAYSLDFDGLDPNTTYHFRAYVKNSAGTAYGNWLDFTTEYTNPKVITHNATDELKNQVTGNGEIVSTGGQDCDERGFEYGLSKVATWGKKESAGGYGVGFFDLTIDGLTANTEYWYRAYTKFTLLRYALIISNPDELKLFDIDGTLLKSISVDGWSYAGCGVTMDSQGNIYLMCGMDYIKKYDSNLNLLKTVSYNTGNSWIESIAIDDDGYLYSLEGGTDYYLVKRNLSDLSVVSSVTITDYGSYINGKFAFDNEGNWYVQANNYGLIYKYDKSGNKLGQIDAADYYEDSHDYTISTYAGCAVLDGHVYFGSTWNNGFIIVSTDLSSCVRWELSSNINYGFCRAGDHLICSGWDGDGDSATSKYDSDRNLIWTKKLDPNTSYAYKAGSYNFSFAPYIAYGEWVKFITAAPGAPGDKPSGYKNDICSDYSGYTYILNRSFTDDGASYKSHFVLSTDLSGKKTLHTNKRLEDIFSYFANKGSGTAKIYLKRNNEPSWQECGEISLAGEEEIIIRHLPIDYLAKTFLIKFVFENDFEFIGLITEAIPIGDRP